MGLLSYMASLYPGEVGTPGNTMPERCSQVVLSGGSVSIFERMHRDSSAFSCKARETAAPTRLRLFEG